MAQEAPDPSVVVGAFYDICLVNRASFSSQQRAIETSAFGFVKMDDATPDEMNYLALPLAASLKRWSDGESGCLITAVASDDLAVKSLIEILAGRSQEIRPEDFTISGDGANWEMKIAGKPTLISIDKRPGSPFAMVQIGLSTR